MRRDAFERVPRRAWGVVLGMAMLSTTVWAPEAGAVNYILSACGDYCTTSCGSTPPAGCHEASSGHCTLAGNISCSSGPALRLDNGTNLDLAGGTVTCSSGTLCYGAAISMTASSSKVYDTTGPPGGVAGPWQFGIDCAGYTGSWVIGIRVDDAFYGINKCAKVEQNVLGRFGANFLGANVGIYTDTYQNSDYIQDNFIQDRVYAISIGTGDKAVTIQRNVFETTPNGSPASNGTYAAISFAGTTSPAVVKNNYVMGSGSTSPSPVVVSAPGALSSATFSNNTCSRTHAGCSSCVSSGYCATAAPAFQLVK